MGAKVFVGNLAFKATRGQLEELFSEIGRPVDIFLPTDRETGRPRGFAIVEFETEDQARQAISRLNEHMLDGRALRLSPAEERRRPPMRTFSDPGGGMMGQGGGRDGFPPKSKGSRRNVRARKRSL